MSGVDCASRAPAAETVVGLVDEGFLELEFDGEPVRMAGVSGGCCSRERGGGWMVRKKDLGLGLGEW